MPEDDVLQIRKEILEVPGLGSEVILQALRAEPVALLKNDDAESGHLHIAEDLIIIIRPARGKEASATTDRDWVALHAKSPRSVQPFVAVNCAAVPETLLESRPEDLVPLADRFLRLYASARGKRIEGFSAPALALMRRCRWPGNVRELEHAVQRAVIFAAGPESATPPP